MLPGLSALGYQKITNLTASVGLTVPAGTCLALITPEGQAVRWRADGTDPTATDGYPLPVGAELQCDTAQLGAIEFIEQAASATLHVAYFGDR